MDNERWAKFFLVACCFMNSLVMKNGYALNKKDTMLLRAAMLFTVGADFCMVLLDDNAPGVFMFCFVQAIYNYRYTNITRVKTQVFLGTLVLLTSLFITDNSVVVLGAAYAVFLYYSVSGAVMSYKKYPLPNNYLILIGMILFAGCDIFVMLYNVPLAALQQPQAKELIQKAIWICYLPSQVLLSSSARFNVVVEKVA